MEIPWGQVVGAVSQIAGAAAAAGLSQMDKDKAMQLIQDSTDAYGKIQIPKLKELLLTQQGKSGMSDIKDDPRYRDQQNAADSQLGDIIKSGGLTLSDRAALNALRNRTQQAESQGRNAILNGMAARGTLDSGAQLAAQLQGNQQSANRLATADEATAALESRRAGVRFTATASAETSTTRTMTTAHYIRSRAHMAKCRSFTRHGARWSCRMETEDVRCVSAHEPGTCQSYPAHGSISRSEF